MTKEIKHTPGPWKTGEASWNEDGEVRFTLHGVSEARVADAHLIAAAPSLLEALELITPEFEKLYKQFDPEGEIACWGQWSDMARAASAKARGE